MLDWFFWGTNIFLHFGQYSIARVREGVYTRLFNTYPPPNWLRKRDIYILAFQCPCVMDLLNYDALLERAYSLLPPRKVRKERLEVDPPEVVVAGKRTFIMNFRQICEILNRDQRIVLRYLLRELGAAGNAEGDVAVIYGVAAPKLIKELMDMFMKNYVYCPVCGSPDTILKREERKFMNLKCMACGAVTPVKPF